jgi:hypothetical protein
LAELERWYFCIRDPAQSSSRGHEQGFEPVSAAHNIDALFRPRQDRVRLLLLHPARSLTKTIIAHPLRPIDGGGGSLLDGRLPDNYYYQVRIIGGFEGQG